MSQSVSWLNSLLKLDICRDIPSSGWHIFLNFFGDIPGMLVQYFTIILNFLYIWQSVSWLTFLLKLDKYRDIFSSGWNIFLNIFEDIPETLVHWFQIILIFLYGCQSGSWHTSLMKSDKFRNISSSGRDIFLNFYGHITWKLVHLSK